MKLFLKICLSISFISCIENKKLDSVCSSKLDLKNKIQNDSIIKKIDTIKGYILEYEYNIKTNKKDGCFTSYFYEKKVKTTKACECYYKNGYLHGNLYLYINDNKILTKYKNIIFDKIKKKYTAKIYVYNKNGKLKEEGYVETNDELDFTLIFDEDSYSIDKIRLNEWKYYKS
jgi:hypothetical protein